MDTIVLLNLAIEFAGIVLCALGILQVAVNTRMDRQTCRSFRLLFIFLILLAASNAAGQMMRGRPGPAWRAALYISNFTEFLCPALLAAILTQYLLSLVDPGRERKGVRAAAEALLGIHIALLVVSQFTGLIYVIDAANVYRRSARYPLAYAAAGGILLMDVVLLSLYGGRLSRRERTAFWIYLAVPIAAMIVQIFVYGVYFVIFAAILGALVLYVFIVNEQTERYLRQEKELSDLRVNMLLSQIRPHFIYNTLTSIYVLCREDPPRAMEVIQDFTAYLQANFTGIAAGDLIAFSDELRHTKAYLAVEAIRYGEKLTVDFDTKHTAFRLPALTLQPLVENAVKYGIGRGHGPEHIVIRTRAEENGAVLTVEDDGPGFDTAVLSVTAHVGVRNVRERLDRMCGGTLDIQSTPGQGTAVTVRIPGTARASRERAPVPTEKRIKNKE